MRAYTVIIVLLLAGSKLAAQTENTRERLIDQLKNGTAPGLLFAKNVPAPVVHTTNTETREGLVAQIRKGSAKGMKFLPAVAVAPAAVMPQVPVAPTGQLVSEQEIKKDTSVGKQ